ncbi:MFS transporter [SAR202 cluster bacterium AD-804-J14_MRT_500m]|nr:MFS transporter [SAR202 cluster bacterium AD-804-J14_MRT_500m]
MVKHGAYSMTPWYAKPQLFRSLTERDWGILWVAGHLWHFAFWVDLLVLGWLVLNISDSPLKVGLVGAARLAPMGVLGVFFGSLGDRFPKRRILLAAQMVNTVATMCLAAVLLAGAEALWHIYFVAIITGCAWAADYPNRRALIRELVPDRLMLNAMSLDIVSLSGMNVLGRLAAGGMLVLVGPSGIYVVLSVAYVVGLFLLGRVKNIRRERSFVQNTQRITLKGLGEAIRYAISLPALRGVLILTVIVNFLVFPYMQMAPVFARDVLDVGPGLLGLMTSVEGLGMMIGAMLLATIGKLNRIGLVFIIGAMFATLSVVCFSLSNMYLVSLTMALLAGIGMSGFATMQNVIPITEARPEMRATALGVVTLAIGAHPLGMVYGGVLAGSVSAPTAVLVNSVVGVALVILVWMFQPGLRKYNV